MIPISSPIHKIGNGLHVHLQHQYHGSRANHEGEHDDVLWIASKHSSDSSLSFAMVSRHRSPADMASRRSRRLSIH